MSLFTEFKDKLGKYGLEWFNKYYGVYSGSVASNVDPLNLGRLSIKCPAVYGKNSTGNYKAFPRNMLGAGSGHGVFWIPNKGDVIRVSFENGDPRHPLWEYGWYLVGKTPENTNVLKKSFVTPTGHRIDMDDTPVTGGIKITNRDGFNVELRPNGIFLGKNSSDNLFKFIDDLLALNQATTTATAIGAQPFINVAAYTTLRAKLGNFLKG